MAEVYNPELPVMTFGNWVLKAEWLSGLWNYMYVFYVFLRFFQNPKNVTFYVFLSCCTRFPEQWCLLTSTNHKRVARVCQHQLSFLFLIPSLAELPVFRNTLLCRCTDHVTSRVDRCYLVILRQVLMRSVVNAYWIFNVPKSITTCLQAADQTTKLLPFTKAQKPKRIRTAHPLATAELSHWSRLVGVAVCQSSRKKHDPPLRQPGHGAMICSV